jgi:hypothetical protein
MANYPVGYYFNSDVKNGGDGFLIGLHRCANFKVPLRDVRFSTKDPMTKIIFAGSAIKHPKGVPYIVDCNVTGSNRVATSSVPCFPLKPLWEHLLMPAIKKIGGSRWPV